MLEDGFQRACDGEPRDWWKLLFGMAPCQALMSLYTVNRWPTSPERVSVFTLWLSAPSLFPSSSSCLCTFTASGKPQDSQQDRAKPANKSSFIKSLESLFRETTSQAFSCSQCRRGRKKPCLSRCCSWRWCPCGFSPGTSWQRRHITTTICTTASVRPIIMWTWTISFLQRYLWWQSLWRPGRSTSVAPFMGSCSMLAALVHASTCTGSFKKTQVSLIMFFPRAPFLLECILIARICIFPLHSVALLVLTHIHASA